MLHLGYRFLRTLSFICLASALWLQHVAVFASINGMELPGFLEASPAGAAIYSIPIKVPAGVAGMVPKLALKYDSNEGDGPFGVGWRLTGLSEITRCPQNRAQDGDNWVGGVNYKATDRFCLDGQRLVAISNPSGGAAVGVYGADQTYYATELAGFTKIQSFGTQGSDAGPTSFKAWTPDGLVMEFGVTEDARVLAVGKNAVRVWALNKITDASGNAFSVSYSQRYNSSINVIGAHLPSSIKYGKSGYEKIISFTYDATGFYPYSHERAKPSAFQGGSELLSRAHIRSISSSAGTYNFSYGVSQWSQRFLLDAISYCLDGQCISSKVKWSNSNLVDQKNPDTAISLNLNSIDLAKKLGKYSSKDIWQSADVNGDGFSDVIRISSINRRVAVDVALNQKNGTMTSVRWITNGGPYASSDKFFVTDVNGDERADIVHLMPELNKTTVEVLVSRDLNFSTPVRWVNQAGPYLVSGQEWHLGDVNGDGRVDLITTYGVNNKLTVDVYLNQGGSLFQFKQWMAGTDAHEVQNKFFVADLNADGRSDVAWLYKNGTSISSRALVSDGLRFLSSANLFDSVISFSNVNAFALRDINGDGLPDFYYYDNRSVYGCAAIDSTYGTVVNQCRNAQANNVLTADLATSMSMTASHGAFFNTGMLSFVNKGMGKYYSQLVWCRYQSGCGTPDGVFNPGDLLAFDIDGDSLVDSVRIRKNGATEGEIYFTNRYIFDSFIPVWSRISYVNSTSDKWLTGDTNGDGASGLIRVFNEGGQFSITAYEAPQKFRDSMVSIQTGLTTYNLKYDLPVLNNLHTGSTDATLPGVGVNPPTWLLAESSSSNGVGGVFTTRYRYGDMRVDPSSGRFLGFRWVEQEDVDAGIKSRTYFRQDFPSLGKVEKRSRGVGGSFDNLGRTTYAYGCYDFDQVAGCQVGTGKRYFVYTNNELQTSKDLLGTGLPGKRTETVYDCSSSPVKCFGNATQIKITTLNADGTDSGYVQTSDFDYFNDEINWRLGQVRRAKVTNVAP